MHQRRVPVKRKTMADAPGRVVERYPDWKCGDRPEVTVSAVVAERHQVPATGRGFTTDFNLSMLDLLQHTLRLSQVLLHHRAMIVEGKRTKPSPYRITASSHQVHISTICTRTSGDPISLRSTRFIATVRPCRLASLELID
jgi:hypothetical protein